MRRDRVIDPVRWFATRWAVIGAVLCLSGCAPHSTRPLPGPGSQAADTLRVLFIGNSLTEAHNLPGMLSGLSRAAGGGHLIETGAVVFGNHSLGDHLERGDAARAIAAQHWDFVTLQQGPSALPESRVDLLASVARFDTLIRASGARSAIYGVWPSESRSFDLDASIESYRLAAEAIGAVLFPVGLAWKTAWQEDAALPLYSDDRFHPSPLGSYAAAVVMWAALLDRTPVGLPSRITIGGTPFEVPADQAAVVQRAAQAVVGTSPR